MLNYKFPIYNSYFIIWHWFIGLWKFDYCLIHLFGVGEFVFVGEREGALVGFTVGFGVTEGLKPLGVALGVDSVTATDTAGVGV